jgi:hypothetical protein
LAALVELKICIRCFGFQKPQTATDAFVVVPRFGQLLQALNLPREYSPWRAAKGGEQGIIPRFSTA